VHLSAGDLLRAERDSGSPNGDLINSYIAEGKIVPIEITCNLIKKAMERAGWDKRTYLIDGFPRSDDNCRGWNEVMGDKTELAGVVYFEADEATMTDRILARAATSGRVDDNIETLKKRFAQFNKEQLPIIMKFTQEGKVIKINACQT
jgi:UMP-CMP kinase